MGNAYRELPGGDRAVNLGKAIGCYTQALRFRTAEATPLDYAATQNELGAAYAGFSPPGTGRRTWLRRSAATPRRCGSGPSGPPPLGTPPPRPTWATPTWCFPPGTGRRTWGRRSAATPRRCGSTPPRPFRSIRRNPERTGHRLRLYSGRGPGGEPGQGDRLLHPSTAVLHFRGGAAPVRHDQPSARRRVRQGSDRGPGGELGAGDRLLHRGAAVPHRRGRPARLRRDPERTGHRLRLSSGRGPGGEPGHRRSGATSRRCGSSPPRPPRSATPWPRTTWATPTGSFPTGDRAANLGRAIGCYTEALRFFTAEAAPSEYARTQHNLGNAYAELPTGDRAANLARAIGCYTEALRFYTAEAAPAEYADDPEQPGQRLRRAVRPGTGRPTWPGRSAATPRRCGSTPPRPPRSSTP